MVARFDCDHVIFSQFELLILYTNSLVCQEQLLSSCFIERFSTIKKGRSSTKSQSTDILNCKGTIQILHKKN